MEEQGYQTSIEMTYEEYQTMCWALKRRKAIIISGIVSMLLLAAGAISLQSGDVAEGIISFGMALVYPCLVFGFYRYSMKKSYRSQKIAADNRRVDYEFYPDRMVVHTAVSRSEIRYDQLYRVKETKTNFYLMIGVNQSMAVKKELCSDELLAFLKSLKEGKKAGIPTWEHSPSR